MNKKSLQNLKPMKKGETRNPNGRPKGGLNSKTILNKFLSLQQKFKNPVTGEFENMSVYEVMSLSIIAKARKGDLNAYKEILDRLEGKAQQKIDHTTDGEAINKVTVEILNYEDTDK